MSAIRGKNVAKLDSTYIHQQEAAKIATARKRKLLFRRLSLFAAFAVFVSYFMISSFLSQAAMIDSKKNQKSELDKQLTDLKTQQDVLKQDIVKLNDDNYIAKLARKEYFFSDKNEIIFNMPDDNKKEKSSGN